MSAKRMLALTAATLVAAATASSAVPRSGLHGTVMRGPITPVCRVGVPCDAPAPNITLTFARSRVVRTTRTDEHGTYRIELPAGIYTVKTSSKPFGKLPRPATVHVRSAHSDTIDFTIDTGIR
jgi:hypothetical protein